MISIRCGFGCGRWKYEKAKYRTMSPLAHLLHCDCYATDERRMNTHRDDSYIEMHLGSVAVQQNARIS